MADSESNAIPWSPETYESLSKFQQEGLQRHPTPTGPINDWNPEANPLKKDRKGV